MFIRLGAWCHDRRRLVLAIWIAVLALGIGLASTVGADFREEFNLPASESRTGFDILEQNFGGQGTNATGTIVFRAEQGVLTARSQSSYGSSLTSVAGQPGVLGVTSPYSQEGAEQISADGLVAYANVDMPNDIVSAELPEDKYLHQREYCPGSTGSPWSEAPFTSLFPERHWQRRLVLAFAIVILILALGSVLAMGLSVGVALSGCRCRYRHRLPGRRSLGGARSRLYSRDHDGTGRRHRLRAVDRHSLPGSLIAVTQSVSRSSSRSTPPVGQVVFAGCTVVISLLSLMLVGVKFVQGLGISAAAVVAVTIVASVTLLPALLGFAGRRVEIVRWRGLAGAGLVALGMFGVGLQDHPAGRGGVHSRGYRARGQFLRRSSSGKCRCRARNPNKSRFAYRWSRTVQHRPWFGTVIAAVILLVLTIPVLSLRLGFSDESNAAANTTTRKAYDLIVEGFGPGFSGPLLLVAETPAGTTPEDIETISAAVRADPGVAVLSPAISSEDGGAVLWNLVPTSVRGGGNVAACRPPPE